MGLNLLSPHRNQFYIEAEKLSEKIFNKEYKNAKERAERIAFKDGSRDMWNNIEGIKYA